MQNLARLRHGASEQVCNLERQGVVLGGGRAALPGETRTESLGRGCQKSDKASADANS